MSKQKVVLVSTRFFGSLDKQGESLLIEKGFTICRIPQDVEVVSEEVMIEQTKLQQPHAIMTGIEPVTKMVMESSINLKVISNHGAGVEHIDVSAAARRGIIVTRTPAMSTEAVAEHAIALLLAVSRNLCLADKDVRSGKWKERSTGRYVGTELRGKVVGVIGTGHIGAEVIKRLSSFGVSFLAYDAAISKELAARDDVRYVRLQQLLEESDFITIHVPLNAKTRNMIGKNELHAMKSTAIFVNTCRGGVVDELALFECLKSGAIAGAGLDVLTQEPPEADNPFFALDNVVLTPHLGGQTSEAIGSTDVLCAENIILALEGSPQNIVR